MVASAWRGFCTLGNDRGKPMQVAADHGEAVATYDGPAVATLLCRS